MALTCSCFFLCLQILLVAAGFCVSPGGKTKPTALPSELSSWRVPACKTPAQRPSPRDQELARNARFAKGPCGMSILDAEKRGLSILLASSLETTMTG